MAAATLRRFAQGQWHRAFGHPQGYVKTKQHTPSVRVHRHVGAFAHAQEVQLAQMFCCECRRHFWKRVR